MTRNGRGNARDRMSTLATEIRQRRENKARRLRGLRKSGVVLDEATSLEPASIPLLTAEERLEQKRMMLAGQVSLGEVK